MRWVAGTLLEASQDMHLLGILKETSMKVSDILRLKGNTLYTASVNDPVADAIQTMAEIDRGPRLNVRPQQFVMYRAFLGPVGELTITRQLISARSRSYLWHDRVSQLSNAERDTRGHTELYLEQLGE